MDDAVSKILKYFYCNQNYDVIKDEINDHNATFLLSQSYTLKAESLKKNIEHSIIEKVLNPDNCTQFYLESLKFENESLQQACEHILVMNF